MSQAISNIIILDFGSQYTQLIARRIREIKVYSTIVRFDASIDQIKKLSPNGIILSGGPASVLDENAPRCNPDLFKLDIPILGICYGLQLLVFSFGGKIATDEKREFGHAKLNILGTSPLFKDLDSDQKVWMSHSDKVLSVPKGFSSIGLTSNTDFAAIANLEKKIYGLQFHPEVVHTENGTDILKNFCLTICKCSQSWTTESWIKKAISKCRTTIKEDKVILGLSGGVDSSVAAAILQKAIGKQLTCVFVNNGLLRYGEEEAIREAFTQKYPVNLKIVDASSRFLKKLKGIREPEEKRKVIGNEFIEIFNESAGALEDVHYLGQGTTYPDVIESVPINGNPSSVIKSHHNVGGLPEVMKLKLIEPIRNLFKDEVRQVGLQLGLPKELVFRQPFPGPGLGIRIIGEVSHDRLEILRKADRIVLEEMKSSDFYYKVWQSFAVLLPICTVGVMGDERSYENVIALRVVGSIDGMTADWSRLPYDLLAIISNRIINEVRGVNRVCYDISSKPPSTIEWE